MGETGSCRNMKENIPSWGGREVRKRIWTQSSLPHMLTLLQQTFLCSPSKSHGYNNSLFTGTGTIKGPCGPQTFLLFKFKIRWNGAGFIHRLFLFPCKMIKNCSCLISSFSILRVLSLRKEITFSSHLLLKTTCFHFVSSKTDGPMHISLQMLHIILNII